MARGRLRSPASVSTAMCLYTTPATTQISTLSLHDALPISAAMRSTATPSCHRLMRSSTANGTASSSCSTSSTTRRSEEHTSELQSHSELVCRLLLEKKHDTYSNDRGAFLKSDVTTKRLRLG